MKKIAYKTTGNNLQEFLLTNKELGAAMALWAIDKNYTCARLRDTLSRFFSYTCDRKHEKRFQHFVNKTSSGTIVQSIFDHQSKNWYEFDKFTDYEKVVENVMIRERGGDAPLRYLPKIFSEQENELLLKNLLTIDDFLDGGGELGY